MRLPLTILFVLVAALPVWAITIETVPVGDVGNPNDPATGNLYGGVNYAYNIGKYEVTVGQYTAFLNAVAATDTYGLYNSSMETDLHSAGIVRSCALNCTYSVISSAKLPVSYVSWGDAARFANWLHNGQPTGAEDATTTEDGAYTLNGATSLVALSTVTRNPGAKWFIPTENEWYKAAYYQPADKGGDADGYWQYPMKTNSEPFAVQPPGMTIDNQRVGNFFGNNGFALTGSTTQSSTQNYLTDVGAYTLASSYYGTFDQGGNVYEWDETIITTNNSPWRGVRGGAWDDFSAQLLSQAAYTAATASIEASDLGFRIASSVVPEPSTILLALTAFAFYAPRQAKAAQAPTPPRASVPHRPRRPTASRPPTTT